MKTMMIHKKVEMKHGHLRYLSCTYGITTVMQLRHFAVMKQQYNSMSLSQGAVPRGRMKEGTPTLGEGELGAIYTHNVLPSCQGLSSPFW